MVRAENVVALSAIIAVIISSKYEVSKRPAPASFSVFLPSLFEDIAAEDVQRGDEGHPVDGEALYGFAAKLGEGDLLRVRNMAGYERPGAADGTEIGGLVADDGVADGAAPFTLPDGGGETEIIEPRRKAIHAGGGCRAAGADLDVVMAWCGAGVVENGVPDVEGERLTVIQKREELFMGGIACRVDNAA